MIRGSVRPRGPSWHWSFTTGSQRRGTRKLHSGTEATEEAARQALAAALEEAERQRQDGEARRIAPAIVDNSWSTMCDLVDSGICTPQCVFGMDEEEFCDCRCGGTYHGIVRVGGAVDTAPDPRRQARALRIERETYQQRERQIIRALRGMSLRWAEVAHLTGLNGEHLSRKYGQSVPRGNDTHCPNGHLRSEHGYRTNLDRLACRACDVVGDRRRRHERRRQALADVSDEHKRALKKLDEAG